LDAAPGARNDFGMESATNMIGVLLAAVARSGVNPAQLSEAEMMARYPVIRGFGLALISIGLICDTYLLLRWWHPKSSLAESRPHFQVARRPWGFTDLAGVILVLILTMIVGQSILGWWGTMRKLPETDRISLSVSAELIIRLLLLAGLIVYLRRKLQRWQSVLGLDWVHHRQGIGAGLLFYGAIWPPLSLVFAASNAIARWLGHPPTPQPVANLLATTDSTVLMLLLTAFALVVAPVFEEIFFRGFAYPAFKNRWGPARSLILVSALFAIVHLHGPSIAPLFTLALGLGLAYEWTGSLWAPITMHALFNLTSIAMMLYVRLHG
jgi:membrane protease YdiL (CAAX protease family)